MRLIAYAGKTHQGPYLNVNEDLYDVDLSSKLFMVFDGFGGAGVGDKVVNDLKNNIKYFYHRISEDPEATLPFYYSPKFLIEGNALVNAARFAHEKILEENENKKMGLRGGSSGVIASLAENTLTILATGNCHFYLERLGNLHDFHSSDNFSQIHDEEDNQYQKNIPLSGFGLFKDLHYRAYEIKLKKDDLVCFFTDGAISRLKNAEIEHFLVHSKQGLKEKIDEIFKLNNERENLDNQTGLILQF